MRKTPSAVDWSEFSVWCFAPNDIAKLERRRTPLFVTSRGSRVAGDVGNATAVSRMITLFRHRSDSFTRAISDGRRRIGQSRKQQQQPVTNDSSKLTTNAVFDANTTALAQANPIRYVYAQFAAGAIGKSVLLRSRAHSSYHLATGSLVSI